MPGNISPLTAARMLKFQSKILTLPATLGKWETQGAPTNSGSGSSDDADESGGDGSDIESGLTTIHL